MSQNAVDMKLDLLPEQRAIREANWFDLGVLRPYLIALKEKQLGFLHCEECGAVETRRFEFHHLRYAMDVALKDLVLLCFSCHRKKPKGVSPTLSHPFS